MDASLLGYLAIGAGGGFLAGKLSSAPWTILGLGVLGFGAMYFVETGGTHLPYPVDTSGGGGGDTVGAGTEDVDTILQESIEYARQWGWTISDKYSYFDTLMHCSVIGAVALRATNGVCAWQYCDVVAKAAEALGQAEGWVMGFQDAFMGRLNMGGSPVSQDGFQLGQTYRQRYLAGAL